MSRIPLIEKPPVFGRIDVADLEEIGRMYDASHSSFRNVFFAEGAKTALHHQALWDLSQNLISYGQEKLNINPNRVVYDLDTRFVNPGHSQRDIDWHVDDPLDERFVKAVVLASSALPTEFLVPGPHYAEFMNRQRQRDSNPRVTAERFTIAPYVDMRLEDGVVETYTPEPGEVVMITNHIHRSPYNHTDATIPRVWLRGWLEELRGVCD